MRRATMDDGADDDEGADDDARTRETLERAVRALTEALGLDATHRFTESLAQASTAMLGKMISKYDVTKVAIAQSRRVLSERSGARAEAFAAECDRLRALRVEELDRYLAVMAKIASDEELAFAVSEAGARAAEAEMEAGRMGTSASGRRRASDTPESDEPSFVSSPGGLGTPERYAALGKNMTSSVSSRDASASGVSANLAGDFGRMTVGSSQRRSGGLFGKPERTIVSRPTELADGPKLPDWNYKRPFLTGAHLGSGAEQDRNVKALSDYGTAEQELLVLDDLLYAMMGVDGRYISAWKGTDDETSSGVVVKDDRLTRVKFEVELGLEAPLAALVKNMLPLCSDAATVRAFIESRHEFKHGYVSHALAAEMRDLLNDWHTLIVQLEHQRNIGSLSLQAAWFYCQPAAPALRLMASVASRAYHLKGASILNLLHREGCEHAGDGAVSALVQRLSKATSAPYSRAIELWVYDGQVDDPYDEFLIVERREMKKTSLADDYNSAYWTKRYSLREEIPQFIGKQLAQKILTTGRYLNAVRETKVSAIAELPAKPRDGLGKMYFGPNMIIGTGKYADRIDDRFEHASRKLLQIMWEDGELKSRLMSMKMYFLLARGDYLVHFLDTAASELEKDADDIRLPKLQTLLDIAVKSSSTATDHHGDDLLCSIDGHGLSRQLSSIDDDDSAAVTPSKATGDGDELSGFDAFVLDYDTPWPASVVLNRRAVTKYQILFRHLFNFKCAERELCAGWQRLQVMRGAQLGRMFAQAHTLTQRMLNFLQNYLYYITNEVIEPHWDRMIARVDDAQSVDELIAGHDAFLEACMKDAMLFWPKILKRLERARAACLRFARDSQRFADTIERLKENSMDAMTADRLVALEEEIEAVTSDTRSQFRHLLGDLLNALNDAGDVDTNVASLLSRLDFNGYYGI